jgi:hypothetical protein
MTPSVEIEIRTAREGTELIQCLWQHGLSAGFEKSAAGLRVVVRSPQEDPPRLLFDLYDALESWHPGRGSWLTFEAAEPHAR